MSGQLCRNPAMVILVLWTIAFLPSLYLLSGTPQFRYIIPLETACMIGSVYYIARFMKEKRCRTG